MAYKHNKTWRIRHPGKRYKQKKEYYARNREHPDNLKNSRQEWTLKDIKRITTSERPPDSVIAKQIGRSVEAIQVKRVRLRV